MTRRIFLNFSRKIPWTLCRLVLFILMLGCFFASMLMDGLTKQVNAQLVGNADLFLSVYTKFSTNLSDTKNVEAATQVIEEYYGMTRTLDPGGNAIYADVSLQSRLYSRVREISWPVPAPEPEEESEEAKEEPEEKMSYRKRLRLEREKRGKNFIITKNAVFLDRETGVSLMGQREDEKANSSTFNDTAKRAIERAVGSTSFVTVQEPEFLKMHLGLVSLVSGRLMTQEEIDSGAAVCLVPAQSVVLRPDGYKAIEPGDKLQVSFYQYSEEMDLLGEDDFDYTLLDSESIDLEVVGTYESNEVDQSIISVYIPYRYLTRILTAQEAFFETHSSNFYGAKGSYKDLTSQPLIFQFDSLERLNAFIENLRMLPEYKENDMQYFANIDQTLHMLSGFYGIADGISSMLSIFGIIAVAFSIITAVLDVFYRRREIAILQSMGESPGKIITQFTLESLLMLGVSAALAAPASLRLMKGVVPSLFSEGLAETAASANNSFAALSGVIEETTLNSAALIEGLGFASSDVVRIVLLLLLMAACCTAAVWVCTKKFNARNLLND